MRTVSLKRLLFFGVFAFAICLYACSKKFDGGLIANKPPETYTIIDTIIRTGNDRLESDVTLNWWGDDADGFITGYEFTFDKIISDATVWIYSNKQDSTFILAPPPGEDTTDYIFFIRAIDNSGEKDATPARLTIPVKNSPPSILFVPGINNPKKSFPVLKFYWQASDPDGEENIKEYELFFNDTTTTPYILDNTVTSAIFEAQNPTLDNFICNVYKNASEIPDAETITGLKANTWNILFIRAVDQSNAKSAFAISDSVFIKKVTSTILLVDGYTSGAAIEDFYATHLSSNGFPVFDTVQIFEQEGGNYTQQSADNLTQAKIFDLFDEIIWFSNDAGNSFSLAQKTTQDFFNSNGKMLMSVYISSSFDPLSNFLDFTPVSSLVDPPDTTLILDFSATLNPVDITYPILQSTSIIGIVKPIQLQIGAEALYTAELTAKDNILLTYSPWAGNSVVMAKKTNGSGETNFIISTLELQKLDGMMNIDEFFNKVMHDEFGL